MRQFPRTIVKNIYLMNSFPYRFEIKLNSIMSELESANRSKEDTKTMIKQTKLQLKQYLHEINRLSDSDYSLV